MVNNELINLGELRMAADYATVSSEELEQLLYVVLIDNFESLLQAYLFHVLINCQTHGDRCHNFCNLCHLLLARLCLTLFLLYLTLCGRGSGLLFFSSTHFLFF